MPTVEEIKAARAKGGTTTKPAPKPAAENPPAEAEPTTELALVQPALPKGVTGRTSLADVDETINELFYGDGGTGKTTALAAMANLGPIVMINAESGIKKRPLAKLGVNVDNISVFPEPGQPLTFDALEELYWELKEEAEAGSIVGVGWDSITEIHKVLLKDVIDKRVAKAERTGRGDTDPFFTDRSDYGVMTEQVRLLVRRYRDLPCHFGATALERRDIDDDGAVVYRPSLTPALSLDVYGYMDIVCHTSVEIHGGEDVYVGTFRPTGKYRAKDRFSAMPRRLPDPSFARTAAYVNDELTEETDPLMTLIAADKDTSPEDGEE